MNPTNIEFKAAITNLEVLERKLKTLDAKFIGIDNQIDTYYNVNNGRLKLREGNIENALIWYKRDNIADVKQSDILLYIHQPDNTLKLILQNANGIKVIVHKKRKIYFVDNVKIHFDEVETLGTFLEVEAISKNGDISIERLKQQCDYFIDFFDIKKQDFQEFSYSDLIVNKK